MRARGLPPLQHTADPWHRPGARRRARCRRRTYDPEAIGARLSDDVEYRYSPWVEPLVGRDAVVADWIANPDEPGSWTADYRPYAVDGHQAVASGTTRYDDAEGRREHHNVFLCRFDDEGRCCSFTEVYLKRR